jgi:hypothetical protein
MQKKLLTKFTPLHDKISEEIRNKKNVPQHNKAIYDKPIANITLMEN